MSKQATYKEVHVPASTLVSFMQAIYNEGRVGTLTVSFGTGGVPSGTMIWREKVQVPVVESTPELDHHAPTSFNYAL